VHTKVRHILYCYCSQIFIFSKQEYSESGEKHYCLSGYRFCSPPSVTAKNDRLYDMPFFCHNRSTTRSTTVLLGVLNVVCRVQTVTSHQQETLSKNDSRFNHANNQFFCADGGAPTDGRQRRRQTYGGAPINFYRRRRREKLGGAPASARRSADL
jgi:hypothetical protein